MTDTNNQIQPTPRWDRQPKSKWGLSPASTRSAAGARAVAAQSGWAYVTFLDLHNPFGAGQNALYIYILSGAVIVLAVLLAWRSFVDPGPLKALFALLWISIELIDKILVTKSLFPSTYWLQYGGAVLAFNGVRGAFAMRRFRKADSKVFAW